MAETTQTVDGHEPELPLSAILDDILLHHAPLISVGELTEKFGGRAIGALTFVFGLACMLPLPPGATTILGFPLVLLAPQLIIGASAPWLPARLKAQTIAVDDLRRSLPRVIRALRRIEAVSKPRLTLLLHALGERLVGVVCLALALVLILPIPGGNMLPALAVSTLSFALIQRDGVIALIGYLLALTSASVLVLAAHVIVRMFLHALEVVTVA
ncbi:MAG: exopolysaccharide biosynthesis protein [Pseudomonadota bacterium]